MGGKRLMSKLRYDITITNIEAIHSLSHTALDSNENALLFKTRCLDLESVFQEFQELHIQLASDSGLDLSPEEHMEKFKYINDIYYISKAKYAELFQTSDLPKANISSTQAHKARSNIMLPSVQLPVFTGKIEEYVHFIDLFESMIGSDDNISESQKMYYLYGSLKGEARSLVQHLSITGENYSVLLDILKNRYGNKRFQADKLLHTLLSINHIGKNLNSLKSFLNILLETSKGLEKLKFPIGEWSYLLLYINLNKIDLSLKRQFEDKYGGTSELPTFDNFISFLTREVQILETTEGHRGTSHKVHVSYSHSISQKQVIKCLCCNGSHYLNKCEKFIKMNPMTRKRFIIGNKLCFRCLNNHSIHDCRVKLTCTKCNSNRHHSLIHLETQVENGAVVDGPTVGIVSQAKTGLPETNLLSPNKELNSVSNVLHAAADNTRCVVLLSTAVIRVADKYGNFQEARALIDGGSQSTFITEKCASRLGLCVRGSGCIEIKGIGGNELSGCRGQVTLRMVPQHTPEPLISTTGLVLNKVSDKLPAYSLPSSLINCYKGLQLADKQFYRSGKIDILIGADVLGDILLGGDIIRTKGLPYAMNTVFGYILQGPYNYNLENTLNKTQSFLVNTNSILEKFWEIEEVPSQIVNPKDEECEAIFKKSYKREQSGRYQVRLPFLSEGPVLGDSRTQALKRFFSMEKRLQSDARLKEKYVEFMREYEDMGHMAPYVGDPQEPYYVIPHHGIFKSGSEKIRVVFDASCITSSGYSLNDCLHAGPKLQQDVMQVISRFRLPKIAFSTDIRMMYRMINIQEEDRKFQLIFWRESAELPVQLYELRTVTYGMKCSPYLAIRTLHQLADDVTVNSGSPLDTCQYENAANVLRNSVYMDDILSGASSLSDARQLKQELIDILASGGFELRKWVSNDKRLLEDIPAEYHEKPHVFETDGPGYFKILGIQWNPVTDNFTYNTHLSPDKVWTKRSILSTLARMFDPMGWITPVILQGKILLQQLWMLRLAWDECPPPEILNQWETIFKNLTFLESIRIDRFILADEIVNCSLHGFADASEKAYGVSVYLRVVDKCGQVKISLVMAKSKVAPIKSKLTIPKLELSGAALLVKLVAYVIEAIQDKISVDDIFCWSDSTIVLSWLKYPPHMLQTFEGNRVLQINNSNLKLNWRYVPSELNPADVASRGCTGKELLSHNLWWGPNWLKSSLDSWPCNMVKMAEPLPGLRKQSSKVVSSIAVVDTSFMEKYSSLSTLISVVAYCLRFCHNTLNLKHKIFGPLSVKERNHALERLVQIVQAQAFSKDIDLLKKNKVCSVSLRRLKPFFDEVGLLRVGGRLERSNLTFNSKHPLLLPKSHALTSLIVIYYHKLHCHAGTTALQAILQTKFWIISARQVIRSHLFKCISCFRTKAKPVEPVMSDLPADRVNATGVFHTVQTDFSGPFLIKASRLRQAKSFKVYLCVFICSATKAVHLEVVGDLSTEAFLAALSRFTSRRGLPSVVRSDCGTNYIGSSRHLNEIQKYLRDRNVQEALADKAGAQGITWKFNPPAASHFGGLFEAVVKSAKTLLKRVIGEQVLTYEELSTVFTRIEAVLNSRPLSPLSHDPEEFEVLTPAHFLIGRPLFSVPEYKWDQIPNSRLGRYQLVHAISQRFWIKWSEQYLHTLQMRHKWTLVTDPPKVGDLVLIKEDNLPPLRWKMARILELLPGKDNVIRVVKLRTASGILTRPVVKICRLPLD